MIGRRFPFLFVAFLAVMAFVPNGASQPAAPTIPATGAADPRLAPFDDLMIDFLKPHPNVPGAALAVAKDSEIVYNRGFGSADGKMPVRPKSKFRIASISKPI